MTDPCTASWPALGTTVSVVVTGSDTGAVVPIVRSELDAIDRACSRFRADSELSAVNSAPGRAVAVSELFLAALDAAVRGAQTTGGLVDPTVGRALRVLGYDRDFAELAPDAGPVQFQVGSVPGWTAIGVDRVAGTVTVPSGVELDFGATAKALCADRAARRVAEQCGVGVLVSLGGDLAVAGPGPFGGWPVGITDDHAAPLGTGEVTVALSSGGLATSTTAVRRWQRAGVDLHHLIDPRTGRSAESCWKTVSVAAESCLDANIAATASVLMGEEAPAWLEARALPARLVSSSGQVVTVGGWCPDRESALR